MVRGNANDIIRRNAGEKVETNCDVSNTTRIYARPGNTETRGMGSVSAINNISFRVDVSTVCDDIAASNNNVSKKGSDITVPVERGNSYSVFGNHTSSVVTRLDPSGTRQDLPLCQLMVSRTGKD